MAEVYLTELDPSYLVKSGDNLVYPGVLDGQTRLYGHMRQNDVPVNNMTTLLANNFVSQTTGDATFPAANFAFALTADDVTNLKSYFNRKWYA